MAVTMLTSAVTRSAALRLERTGTVVVAAITLPAYLSQPQQLQAQAKEKPGSWSMDHDPRLQAGRPGGCRGVAGSRGRFIRIGNPGLNARVRIGRSARGYSRTAPLAR